MTARVKPDYRNNSMVIAIRERGAGRTFVPFEVGDSGGLKRFLFLQTATILINPCRVTYVYHPLQLNAMF